MFPLLSQYYPSYQSIVFPIGVSENIPITSYRFPIKILSISNRIRFFNHILEVCSVPVLCRQSHWPSQAILDSVDSEYVAWFLKLWKATGGMNYSQCVDWDRMYIHACMHAYIHTYIHTYVRTYIHVHSVCIFIYVCNIHISYVYIYIYRERARLVIYIYMYL